MYKEFETIDSDNKKQVQGLRVEYNYWLSVKFDLLRRLEDEKLTAEQYAQAEILLLNVTRKIKNYDQQVTCLITKRNPIKEHEILKLNRYLFQVNEAEKNKLLKNEAELKKQLNKLTNENKSLRASNAGYQRYFE